VRRRSERGFTLVELMVSLAASSIILAAAVAYTIVQSRAQRDTAEIQIMQSGVRASLDRILRDARAASGGFSATGELYVQDTDHPMILTLPAVSVTTLGNGTDQLDIVFPNGRGLSNIRTVINPGESAPVITVADVTGFSAAPPDNYVIVSTGPAGVLCRVDAVVVVAAPAGTLRLGNMGAAAAFPPGVATFPVGSLVMTASLHRYVIDTTLFGAGAREPALMLHRGGQLGLVDASGQPFLDPVATQIEDLQVALGFDGINGLAADGQLTENGTAANDDEWVYNFTGETVPLTGGIPDLSRMRAVRVSLVARSLSQQAVGTAQMRVEDHDLGTAGERFFRRVLRGVTNVRNLGM
jgi:prepilin-type N-terminal cleavage/methylation domain-containing protein